MGNCRFSLTPYCRVIPADSVAASPYTSLRVSGHFAPRLRVRGLEFRKPANRASPS